MTFFLTERKRNIIGALGKSRGHLSCECGQGVGVDRSKVKRNVALGKKVLKKMLCDSMPCLQC